MTNARIEFTLGSISFSGEGTEDWLANQLDKIIEKAPDLLKIAPVPKATKEEQEAIISPAPTEENTAIATLTLPMFLRQKNITREQLKRFLATAVWLHAKGQTRITTGNVIKALSDSNQPRLGNAADSLNKNVTKGFCEKDGRQFFVTDEGKASL